MPELKYQIAPSDKIIELLSTASAYLEQAGCFFGQGTDNAWDDCVQILFWVMDLDTDPGQGILNHRLEKAQAKQFENAINLRADTKIPAAYITGIAWFCGLKFEINQEVLIPRSPFAELIRNDYRPWIKKRPQKILDLCCGSGCIGIAAAIFDEQTKVVLADLSSEALGIAKKNIARFDLSDRVEAIASDLFDALPNEKFDLILTNPPYVDCQDIASMPEEYKHEPAMALGSGDDGLDITRRILAQADEYLTDQGLLILEVGNSWVNLEAAYPEFPFTWICFEEGGDGVCAITKKELTESSLSPKTSR